MGTDAQFSSPMKAFPTPQAASFGVYNQLPVNGFTGMPDISIPFYTLQHKGISVPISLSYHPASVKPSTHPGWVGLGWNLLAGGCITRKVNGYQDERQKANQDGNPETGYFAHYSKLDADDWYAVSKINQYLGQYELTNETMPDEFYFNFCGYSGSFYMDHKGKWQVCSDSPIKVLFNKETDCIPINNLRNNLRTNISNYAGQAFNHRFINTITLVTPDGIQYRFGGTDATEYTIPYFSQVNGVLIATSWFLTKITSPNGYSVTLNYTPGDPIFEVKPLYTSIRTENQKDHHTTGCLSKWNEACREFILLFPVYLDKISVDEDSERYISFDSGIREDLKLTNDRGKRDAIMKIDNPKNMVEKDWGVFYYEQDNLKTRAIFAKGDIDLFKWRKLNYILINDGTISKQLLFEYEIPDSIKRIRLNRVIEFALSPTDKNGIYKFNYYGENDLTSWPSYFTDQEDHWGFLNGRGELKGTINKKDYELQRIPSEDIKIRTSQILSDITYPTGGRVHFDYEMNDYSKYNDYNYNLQTCADKLITGGIRIKRVIRYSDKGKADEVRSFYYKKNFNSLTDTAANKPSSGILAKLPSYNCTFKATINDKIYEFDFFSSGTMGPYLCNSNGSHIGYSNVIEVSKDGAGKVIGYKKSTFSNFERDMTGNNHENEPPLYRVPYDDRQMNYFSDKSIERGKLQYELFYTKEGVLRKKNVYTYTKTPGPDYVRALSYNSIFTGLYENNGFFLEGVLRLIDAYKFFTYSYKLSIKREFVYNENGTDSICNSTSFKYNNYKMIEKESHTTSQGNLVTLHKYVQDSNISSTSHMILKLSHIFAPIERKTYLEKSPSVFISKETFSYSVMNNRVFLSSYNKALKDSTNSVCYYQCSLIDKHGNPLEIKLRGEPETAILWSENGIYPIVEVKNSTYEKAKSIINNCENDFTCLNELSPESQVTLFDFSKNSQKIKEQNMRGLNTYYKYNTFGWLESILNNQSYILKQYDYGFKN